MLDGKKFSEKKIKKQFFEKKIQKKKFQCFRILKQ